MPYKTIADHVQYIQENGYNNESSLYLLEQYDPLLLSIVHNPFQILHARYSIRSQDKSDFYAELRLRFLELIHEYDPDKSQFSRYISSRLKWYGYQFACKQYASRYQHEYCDENLDDLIVNEEEDTERDFLLSFSEDLQEMIDELKPRQRQVLSLYKIGFTLKEIGEQLKMDQRVAQKHKDIAIRNLIEKNKRMFPE